MSLPIVAIVGRPNVGKSRLFNRLVGGFTAIVDPLPGVTRDRHYGVADWCGKNFIVVDTGGLIPGTTEILDQKIFNQTLTAIEEADLILFLFDGREGIHPLDNELVNRFRKLGKPIIFCVNKIDQPDMAQATPEFSKFEDAIFFSADHGFGISDLLEKLYEILPKEIAPPLDKRGARNENAIAIVGRPNVGKSTLINQLAQSDRVVAHEEAGTTRSSIDVKIEWEGKSFTFVDTAGVKKRSKTLGRIEKFSVVQTLKAIERSKIVLLLIDVTDGLTHQDMALIYHVWEQGKGLILVVNKWDQVEDVAQNEYIESLRANLGALTALPILCLSAKTGKGCQKIWPGLEKISLGLKSKIKKNDLNDWLKKLISLREPPMYKGKKIKIAYVQQTGESPPQVAFYTNEPAGIKESYRRFLVNQLAEVFQLEGVPVRMLFRKVKR
ncbi:MAG: ribosome biogenesis GTPase Der [Deltaproteobacteria bacterium]|nr:ribosome biogenesis GTPase Der [Deltaproteobacteria bacterium]